MNRIFRSVSFVLAFATFGLAIGAGPSAKFEGGVLVGAKGMTLYTYDRDTAGSGKSACDATCASNWPPFLAEDGAAATGDYSVVTTYNAKKQWAYKGKPLYYWAKDKKAGDKTGDGVGKVWHVLMP